jgi:two-component system sensor histidine kinase BarA
MTDYLLLALPCHAQINAEELKNDGAAACLLKPLTATRCCPPSRSIAVLASMPFR